MAYLPTSSELRAYTLMQARMLALLLRFSEGEYRKFFDAHSQFAREEDMATLQVYRDLGVLFFLNDELFEHILPRIIRRLSFASPRRLVVEEPPGRGRIDWERTLDRAWNERPGQPPLELHTRQSLRDFATPENLLAVVTLLAYRADVRRILLSEAVGIGAEALRHPLNIIVERCNRELAFPQLAGIRPVAQRILESGGDEELERSVVASAIPGGNSAYDDLLEWRRRYRELGLLRRLDAARPIESLGADPRRDNRLYQLWILFEIADLLARRDLLEPGTLLPRVIRFRWGEGNEARHYELRHDQAIANQAAVWLSEPPEQPVPGVRPDYYLRRIDPPMTEVHANGSVTWREPGVVWDAKYYRETDANHAPGGPIKRMVADLALTGETRGALLFAFLRADTDELAQDALQSNGEIILQRLRPAPESHHGLAAEVRLEIASLRPDRSTEDVHQALERLLHQAHTTLSKPLVPTCQGIFLDTLSASERMTIMDRWGETFQGSYDDLLVCPKPHIGPWRIDLVSRAMHCCRDGRLCHIMGQPGAQKPVRPPRDIESLLKELDQVLAEQSAGARDDEAVSAIAERVQRVTRRFAELVAVDLEYYRERVRALGMRATFDLLGPNEQDSLALAIFLTDQLFKIRANDYSAPAIHLSSVVEIEVKRRIFACPDLAGDLASPKRQTLGVLPYLRRSDDPEGNWGRINAYVAVRWQENPNPDDVTRIITFDDFISKGLSRIAQLRNNAAHTEPLPRRFYDELQDLIFQGSRFGFGVLNTLLLAWQDL